MLGTVHNATIWIPIETTRNAHSKQELNQQIKASYLPMNENFFLFPTKCFYCLKLLFKRRLFILNYVILLKAIPCTETFGINCPISGKYYASGLKRRLFFFYTFMSYQIPNHCKKMFFLTML